MGAACSAICTFDRRVPRASCMLSLSTTTQKERTMLASELLPAAARAARSPAVAAREVLKVFWDGASLPIDPGRIASDMGIRVYARGGADDPYDFSGYFRWVGDQPIIEYHREDSLVRRRFTVAHELGHYVLQHRDAPRDVPDNFGASVRDPQEQAANQFATELLMPADLVRRLVLSGSMSSVQDIANALLVSKVVLSYRLTNLELNFV